MGRVLQRFCRVVSGPDQWNNALGAQGVRLFGASRRADDPPALRQQQTGEGAGGIAVTEGKQCLCHASSYGPKATSRKGELTGYLNNLSDLTTRFAALGDPTRFAIVERLMTNGELSAGELQDVANVSAPAISRHLKLLREAGLIRQRVDAQRRIYSIEPEAIRAIGTWSMSRKKFWGASLDRLADLLGEESPWPT